MDLQNSVSGQFQERRTRRSQDPLVALHYQLSTARSRGELDALVLADPSGVVVAGAGSWPLCEELAAYAPFFARSPHEDGVSERVASLRSEVSVLPMDVEGQSMLLCARGGARGQMATRTDIVADAATGVSRILSARPPARA